MSRASAQYPERLRAARERLIATNINDAALNYCIEGLARVEEVLRRPLRVVILGENNSGKTSVTDLLIGQGLLPTSVVSNTHVPVLITYAESAAIYGVNYDGTEIRIDSDDDDALTDLPYRALQIALPIERLKTYQILDTPPSANPATFVGDADIVVWCTVATRAWTESERAAWSALPQRCNRNALLVATHKDGLDTQDDITYVTERLKGLTRGQFRDVVLVDAEGAGEGGDASQAGADVLREAIQRLASDIAERRMQKAEKIVRRLARLTFHHFGSDEVRPETVELLIRWEIHARHLLELLKQNRQSVPETIEALLVTYAVYAEKLRPGVVRGDDTIAGVTSRALTTPIRWPQQNTAAARLVRTLASDLTGLLRMLSGHSTFADPAVRAEYHVARAIVLTLADLDGAFDALGRMLGSSLVSEQRSA
ncbi:hypothetical protein [Hyphomicrobium sp.]|uniref:hypothetical protein n=1 Tax=Hyphomicrobium sp. TaxID=82 RepID=UPI0025C5108C|nr:hypothetical protein [Hyphomicrobium sp.]MCC7251782.1 hypothetical protein [Hyphomicrobium sp.]